MLRFEVIPPSIVFRLFTIHFDAESGKIYHKKYVSLLEFILVDIYKANLELAFPTLHPLVCSSLYTRGPTVILVSWGTFFLYNSYHSHTKCSGKGAVNLIGV